MGFLETMEPFILSKDEHIRQFALETINESLLGTSETFIKALKALDQIEPSEIRNSILPNTRSYPFSDEVMMDVIKRLEKRDANFHWYCKALQYCDTTLLNKYKEDLSKYVDVEALNFITSLLDYDTEELFLGYGELVNQLKYKYDHQVYLHCKRIFQELIKRGEYSNHVEIVNGVMCYLEDEFINFDGIFNVFLAGECQVDSLVPTLVSLLLRVEEDFLIEEVSPALIKIGTEQVIQEVAKIALLEDVSFAAVEILGSIKRPSAEKALLELFDQADDLTTKTLIAEALCKQLSTEAIPKVAAMIKSGYDSKLLELEEPLYACCVITNTDHPDLSAWKVAIHVHDKQTEEVEKRLEQRFKPQQQGKRPQAKTKKIGRNDPCPCGSGKKYKKCCGA